MRLTAQWIVTVGEAFWLKVRNGLALPTELHPIPPTNIVPLVGAGIVSGYLVTDGNGRKVALATDEVVRFYFPDPENLWASEGYLGPAGITADSLKFAGQHLRKHYEVDATPKTVMKALEGAEGFTPEEKQAFQDQWMQHYNGRIGTARGAPALLPTNWDLITLAASSGADVVPLLDHWRDEQLMGYGVPRSVLGQVVSGDRSSAETNQYVFDLHTILPIAMLIADGITLQLAHDFDESLFVEFGQFVSDDKRFTLEKQTADLVGKVRSINQVREDDGLDPVPWGEEPVGKLGEVPYTGEEFSFEPDDDGAFEDEEPEDEDEEDEEEERQRSNGGASHFAPEAEWQRQLNREKAYVPSFERAMRTVLQIQERDVLRKLRKAVPRARVSAGELFTPGEWVGLFEKKVEPVRVKAFVAIMGETLSGLGLDDEFVMTDEMRFVLRQQGALLVKHANTTTQNAIARQLEKGVAEGEGVDQLAKRIQGAFTTRRHQARTIARTEVLKASQQAQLASFELAGVEKKQWHTSMDDAFRDSHGGPGGTIDEPIVPRGQPFRLDDGELADSPGIGAFGAPLSAGNLINCRCFVLPVRGD
jgi:SPP1 gp7 family putative phage head morphogenesis protein